MNKKKLVISAAVGAAAGVAGYKLGKKHREASVSHTDNSSITSSRPILPVNPSDVGFDEYGNLKTFNIDKERSISVLITGAGSYIGETFRDYASHHYPNIHITTLDMIGDTWKEHPFKTEDGRAFDTVFHVAGIAHADVGRTTELEQERYYRVNTDLAIEVARHARDAGVRQFIFMSSMIVYGGEEHVTASTVPKPANFYGNSKWLADVGVRKLATEDYKVAVLRPPMIYGKGSKGNYPTLSKIARRVPVFPRVQNRRSMLYIENLCEFVAQLSMAQVGGVYFPQNSSFSNTGELVKAIAEASGHKVRLMKLLTPAVWVASRAPSKKIRELCSKAFGSSYYDQELSTYEGLDYQKVSLEESIRRTEAG